MSERLWFGDKKRNVREPEVFRPFEIRVCNKMTAAERPVRTSAHPRCDTMDPVVLPRTLNLIYLEIRETSGSDYASTIAKF